jgi:hypothetical protein
MYMNICVYTYHRFMYMNIYIHTYAHIHIHIHTGRPTGHSKTCNPTDKKEEEEEGMSAPAAGAAPSLEARENPIKCKRLFGRHPQKASTVCWTIWGLFFRRSPV